MTDKFGSHHWKSHIPTSTFGIKHKKTTAHVEYRFFDSHGRLLANYGDDHLNFFVELGADVELFALASCFGSMQAAKEEMEAVLAGERRDNFGGSGDPGCPSS